MSVDIEARRESLSYLQNEDILTLPMPVWETDVPDREEVDKYLEGLKPRHYSAMAGVIGLLVDEAVKQDLGSTRFPESKYMNNPFQILKSDSIGVFRQSIEQIANTEEFNIASEYPRVIWWLDPNRHINLYSQLLAGWDTAASFMATTLWQFPKIVTALSQDADQYSPTELSAIAKRSVGLPWQMAMQCVNQMMAVRETLDDGLVKGSWSPGETSIDVSLLNTNLNLNRVVSVRFINLDSLVIPKGFTPHDSIPPLENDVALRDIECNQSPVIGCPITLLPGKLNELWNWFIGAVEQRDLWGCVKQ